MKHFIIILLLTIFFISCDDPKRDNPFDVKSDNHTIENLQDSDNDGIINYYDKDNINNGAFRISVNGDGIPTDGSIKQLNIDSGYNVDLNITYSQNKGDVSFSMKFSEWENWLDLNDNHFTFDYNNDFSGYHEYILIFRGEDNNNTAFDTLHIFFNSPYNNNNYPTINLKFQNSMNDTIYIPLNNTDISWLTEPFTAYEAFDNEDGDITNNVTVENNIDTYSAGQYYINYIIKDSQNFETHINKIVIVSEQNYNKNNIYFQFNYNEQINFNLQTNKLILGKKDTNYLNPLEAPTFVSAKSNDGSDYSYYIKYTHIFNDSTGQIEYSIDYNGAFIDTTMYIRFKPNPKIIFDTDTLFFDENTNYIDLLVGIKFYGYKNYNSIYTLYQDSNFNTTNTFISLNKIQNNEQIGPIYGHTNIKNYVSYGTYLITYNISDNFNTITSSSRILCIKDTKAPIINFYKNSGNLITSPLDTIYKLNNTNVILDSVYAYDSLDNKQIDLTSNINIDVFNFLNNFIGSYTINQLKTSNIFDNNDEGWILKYYVEDSSKNKASITRIIKNTKAVLVDNFENSNTTYLSNQLGNTNIWLKNNANLSIYSNNLYITLYQSYTNNISYIEIMLNNNNYYDLKNLKSIDMDIYSNNYGDTINLAILTDDTLNNKSGIYYYKNYILPINNFTSISFPIEQFINYIGDRWSNKAIKPKIKGLRIINPTSNNENLVLDNLILNGVILSDFQ